MQRADKQNNQEFKMLDVGKVRNKIVEWLENPNESKEDIAALSLDDVRTYIDVAILIQKELIKKGGRGIHISKIAKQYQIYATHLIYGTHSDWVDEYALHYWVLCCILINLKQKCRELENLEKSRQENTQLFIAKQLLKLTAPSDNPQNELPTSIEHAETQHILDLLQSKQQLEEQKAELTALLQKKEIEEKEQRDLFTSSLAQNDKLTGSITELKAQLAQLKKEMKQLSDELAQSKQTVSPLKEKDSAKTSFFRF